MIALISCVRCIRGSKKGELCEDGRHSGRSWTPEILHYLVFVLKDLVAIFGIEFYDVIIETRESKGLQKVYFGLD